MRLNDLALPAIGFGVSARLVCKQEDLRYLRENSLDPPKPGYVTVPQYFWGADDRWFQAIDIVKLRRAPFLMRFKGADDLLVAEFDLMELPSAPPEWPAFYRHLSELVGAYCIGDKAKKSQARRELRDCRSSSELASWMRTYLDNKPGQGY